MRAGITEAHFPFLSTKRPVAVDKTVTLSINGSHQRVRLCAARAGLPPLLVVQVGPGFPMLHEVAKFQRLLNLEHDFLVAYWEQRGCGNVPSHDAERASLQQQVEDLQAVLEWLHDETRQRVLLFGISLGATIALLAAAREPDRLRAVVAISPDAHTPASDTAADAFIQEQLGRADNARLRRAAATLGPPPYLHPQALRRRARLLAGFGAIEHGKTFNASLRETLFAMIRTYGVLGTLRGLRNMNVVQRAMLPELSSLDLIGRAPRIAVPVHFVFGEQDALTPAFIAEGLPAAIGASGTTIAHVAAGGHMVHFDQPAIVRSIVERV